MEVEKETEMSLPNYLSYTGTKLNTVLGSKKHVILKPTTQGPWHKSNDLITFSFTSSGFLDPYSLFIHFRIVNASNVCPMQVDNSIHSLFSEITFKTSTGFELEKITDYDMVMANISDLTKGTSDRKAGSYAEGYGYGFDKNAMYQALSPLSAGNCETVIHPASLSSKDMMTSSYDIIVRNANLVNRKPVMFYQVSEGLPTVDSSSSISFIMPVYSFFFGWGVTSHNYKYIPMFLLPGLEVSFKINPYAFFLPIPLGSILGTSSNSYAFKNLRKASVKALTFVADTADVKPLEDKNGELIKLFPVNEMEVDRVVAGSKIGNAEDNLLQSMIEERYKFLVLEPELHWDEIILESNVANRIATSVGNSFTLSGQVYSKIKTHLALANNLPNIISMYEGKASVKMLNLTITNEAYKMSPFARKSFRYNCGINKIWLRLGSDEVPTYHPESNSWTTGKIKGNDYLFTQMKKCALKTKYQKEITINPYNFALNMSILDVLANSETLFIPIRADGYAEMVGRCILSIDFERLPQTKDDYWSGISTRRFSPYDLNLEFAKNSNKYWQETKLKFEFNIFVLYDKVLRRENNQWIIED